ncbi:ABC-three component system protein [Streptomyces polygonati]|uniref:ABC-three component system protein n=1 Tax=Streptomyces polygonati TaxID=1617087 RepID=A0ABV8HUL6_9ACTN
MTGYLYQCELALVELAERSLDDPVVEVRMEVLDDVEFLHGAGSPSELLQSKHRRSAGQLSETGKDFWRSVASWIDALTVLGTSTSGPMPLLRLVTTQVATEGTFFYLLRGSPQRDVAAALDRMEAVAIASEPETTAEDRRKFMDLTPPQRYRLVAAIEISDGAPLMSDLDHRLARALGIAARRHGQAVLDQIKGWWYRMAVQLLERKNPALNRPSVSAQELQCRIEEITDQFAGQNLPVTQELRRLTEAETAAYRDQLVVRQMQWIGLNNRSIAMYLRDYHHASAQRSQWLRAFTITEQGLEEYEQRLWDEWDHISADLTDGHDQDSEDKQASVGKEVLKETMDAVADEPARLGSTTVGWIGRGTMHSLADRAGTAQEPVGWHPRFRHLLGQSAEDEEQGQ